MSEKENKITGFGIIRTPLFFEEGGFKENGELEVIVQVQILDIIFAQEVFDILKRQETSKEVIVDYLALYRKARVWNYQLFNIETKKVIDNFLKLREEFRR